MNKKEINEIKKGLSKEDGLMNINRVITAYVDAEKNIQYFKNENFNIVEEETGELIMKNIVDCFKGNIGKSLLEYQFPTGSTNQSLMYNTLHSNFVDDDTVKQYVQHLIDTIEYVSTYAIFIAYCKYSVISKNKNDEVLDGESYTYNFFVTAICPVSLKFNGLVCTDTPEIVKESNIARVVENTTDGIIFPTFSDRQGDINSVMYYTSKPKQPNTSIIEETLGCEFVMPANSQKEAFNYILKNTLGEELNYETVTCINDVLTDKLATDNLETDPSVVTVTDIGNVLKDVGMSVDKIENVKSVFTETIGEDKALNTEALVDGKTKVTSGPFTITFDKSHTHLFNTAVVNGKKVITLEIDEPLIVNGIEVDN